jgi:hypothetical protein
MKKRLSAQELEFKEVSCSTPKAVPAVPGGEAMAMLVRRGLKPERFSGDLPFPGQFDEAWAERVSDWLSHYAFRLFFRGAIQKSQGFRPEETTRYLKPDQAKAYADALVELGLAAELPGQRYRLNYCAKSFGGILEWYVGRELGRRLGFDVATGVKLHVRGGGGDLDIVAAAEGKLVYLELKSSPPRNLASSEISAFCSRLHLLHPDLSLFVVDTALRLSDKVLPMLVAEFRRRDSLQLKPNRIAAQLWALTPRLYVVNGSRDLMANIGKGIAAGLRSLSPIKAVDSR